MRNGKKRTIRNTAILISPFLLMIIINEIARPTVSEKPYSQFGVTAINSADRMPHKCSWACHNDTIFCQAKHTTFMGPYFKNTDPVYYGAIGLLMKTGAYGPANLFVFVFLFPLIIWFFISRSLNIQDKIKASKKRI